MYCSKCGAENADDSAFCSKCGSKLASPDSEAVNNYQSYQQPLQNGYQQQDYYYRPQQMLSPMGYSNRLDKPKDSFLFAVWEKAFIFTASITTFVYAAFFLISELSVLNYQHKNTMGYILRNYVKDSWSALEILTLIFKITVTILLIIFAVKVLRLSRPCCIALIVIYGYGFVSAIVCMSTQDYDSPKWLTTLLVFKLLFCILMLAILPITQYRLSTTVQAPRIRQLTPEKYGKRFLDSYFTGTPWICPHCGTSNAGKDVFCQKCGKNRPYDNKGGQRSVIEKDRSATWACPKCGMTNPSNKACCPSCGEDKPTIKSGEEWMCKSCGEPNPKSRSTCKSCGKRKI